MCGIQKMTELAILMCAGIIIARFDMVDINATKGSPLGLAQIGFLPHDQKLKTTPRTGF